MKSNGERSIIDSCFCASLVALGFMFVVLPNSNRSIALPLFVVAALLSVSSEGIGREDRFIWCLLTLSGAVTTAYLAVGAYKGGQDAIAWVLFVYVVSPAIWILIVYGGLRRFSPQLTINWLIGLGCVGALSVFAYVIIFFSLGPTYLTVFISEPSAGVVDGQPAVAMHVLGSLLFVCGGFFSAAQLVRSIVIRSLVAIVLLGAVLLSGRSALFLSVMVGLSVAAISGWSRSRVLAPATYLWPVAAVFLVALMLINIFVTPERLDLGSIPGLVVEKVLSGGGEERVDQAISLWKGIVDSWGGGAGHGIGVDYIRDFDQPWRYELLWLATLFRVGVFGSLIYVAPVFIFFALYIRNMFLEYRRCAVADFMFGGGAAVFLATATNPYLESFEFQWMLILPFLYFVQTSRCSCKLKTREIQN